VSSGYSQLVGGGEERSNGSLRPPGVGPLEAARRSHHLGRSIPGRSDSIGTTPAPGGPRAGPVTCTFGHRLSSAELGDSQKKGVRPWMGRERDGRATRFARRGTYANGSGGLPASWVSRRNPVTPPHPRRPTPGAPRPRERDGNDHGAGRAADESDLPLSPGGPRRRDPPVPQPRLGADRRDGPLAQAAAEQRAAPARDRRPATRRSSRRPRSWTTCRRSPADRRPRRQSRRPPG
jgi:hypothetical protein